VIEIEVNVIKDDHNSKLQKADLKRWVRSVKDACKIIDCKARAKGCKEHIQKNKRQFAV
jgi:hypothetical protein